MLRELVIGACLLAAGTAAAGSLSPQSIDAHGVKTIVTPREVSGTSGAWEFEVLLETHTRALDEDMANVAVLIAGGKRYAPVGWYGSPPGGHHRKGTLRFKAIVPPPSALTLQIRMAGEETPRAFVWPLRETGAGH